MDTERLRTLAPDLNRTSPRSPYSSLGRSFAPVAARLVDKCRAELLGQSADYHFNCPLDRKFFAAAGLEADPLREFIATGANDDEVAAWIGAHSRTPIEKIPAGDANSGQIRSGIWSSWTIGNIDAGVAERVDRPR